MQVSSTVVIGGTTYTFTDDDPDDKVALSKAIALASPRTFCNVCDTDGLDQKQLVTNRTKDGYIYIKTHCLNCGANSNLGEYRTGDGYFWKEYELYVPDDGEERPQEQRQSPQNRSSGAGITNEAVDAIVSEVKRIGWDKGVLSAQLGHRYGKGSLTDLSLDEGREFWSVLHRMEPAPDLDEMPF